MSDFLSYVESNYGCVAEYNRCREEDAEYEAEQQYKRNQYYKKNKEKLDKAKADGTLVWFSDSCYESKCPSYTDIGMSDSEDDITHGSCGNLNCIICEYRKNEAEWKAECERREKERAATIKRAYTDTKAKENTNCLVEMCRERADDLKDCSYNYDRLKTLINMYLEADEKEKLKIEETTSLLLGLSIHDIAQKMLGEFKDIVF